MWNKVEDKLPQITNGYESTDVLVYDAFGLMSVCSCTDEGVFKDIRSLAVEATHWMPLPAPPKQPGSSRSG